MLSRRPKRERAVKGSMGRHEGRIRGKKSANESPQRLWEIINRGTEIKKTEGRGGGLEGGGWKRNDWRGGVEGGGG